MGHKRINNIYDQIYNYENLLKAYRKARKNKRYRTEVLAYTARLSENLLELQKDFKTCTYHPKPYRSFTIYEPKERIIRALPFKDRVAQHALCNVIRSIIERGFYAHSYACIDGRGAHKASHDLSRWYYRLYREWDGNVWVLKGDIHSYFASMSHDVLKRQYRKEIKDRRVLALLDCIVDHNGTGEPVGVPVGNLTSQLFGGMYLTPLDRFVKETLRAKWYMRYMDDFVILARSRLELVEQLEKITEFLHTELRLELNPKTKIYKPMHGIDFVGYRHFHDYRLIRKDSITRCRRRIRRYAAGEVSWNQLHEQLTSWTGHASHADACGIVRKIWAEALAAKAARESANKDGEAYDGARDSPRSA